MSLRSRMTTNAWMHWLQKVATLRAGIHIYTYIYIHCSMLLDDDAAATAADATVIYAAATTTTTVA